MRKKIELKATQITGIRHTKPIGAMLHQLTKSFKEGTKSIQGALHSRLRLMMLRIDVEMEGRDNFFLAIGSLESFLINMVTFTIKEKARFKSRTTPAIWARILDLWQLSTLGLSRI